MRYHSPQRNIVVTIFLAIFMVLSLNACGDSNNVSGPPAPAPFSPDAKLSSFTVTPGTLQPAFSGDVRDYTMDVTSNVANVTVTARPQNAGATVSINGQTTTSRSVSLTAPGSSTSLTITVTAPNGSQNTYIVTVNRAALSGNNSLRSLTVSPGTLAPAFNANTLNYFVNVDSTVANVAVRPTLQDINASMTVIGLGPTRSGQARTILLLGPGSSTPVTIIVTAPNGTQKTYTVAVQRAALGGNNNLQSLTVSPGTFFPLFNANTPGYFVNVDSTVTKVTVTATLQDAHASMTVIGLGPTRSGQARTILLLGPGSSTPITIIVTAPNGTQKTYSVSVQRAAVGGNTNLQSLTVSPSTFFPPLNASTASDSVNVDSTAASIVVAAQPQDSGATISINGQTTTTLSVPLGAVGSSTTILIEVTAPNGSQKTYTVLVNRTLTSQSGNNNLSTLDLSAEALPSVFDAANTSYDVVTTNTIPDTTLTATVADPTATLTINDFPATSGVPSVRIPLAPGATTSIPIVVTAENGTPKTYTVNITMP
jgi:hypothetical protein